MELDTVSVIIPVYNVEKHLDRCISSIVNQTFCNLDIILIDDGSPDGCPQMCDEWVKRDSRIRVIHKQNEGLGMARNTGIENAFGEYICFFDSDDYVAMDTIKIAYDSAKKNSADMVCYGMHYVDTEGRVIRSVIPAPEKYFFENEGVRNEFLVGLTGRNPRTGKQWNVSMSACCKLFSMELIRKAKWRFVSEREIISEDFYSLLELCSHVERVSIVPEGLYFYCMNDSSLTHTYRPDRFEKACHFYKEVVRLCRDLGYSQEIIDHMDDVYLSFVITALKQENSSLRTKREIADGIKRILDNDLLQSVLGKRKGYFAGLKKEILFWAIRSKYYLLCNFLLTAQNFFGK